MSKHALLRIAAMSNDLSVARALLRAGASPNVPDEDGETALILATRRSLEDMVELLLNAGADEDASDNDGWTSLHWAAWHGDYNICVDLLNHDADFRLRTTRRCTFRASGTTVDSGVTALTIAEARGHQRVAGLIKRKMQMVGYDSDDDDINTLATLLALKALLRE